jgi:curli biogenesis system outer membrane secretion channel CsgG
MKMKQGIVAGLVVLACGGATPAWALWGKAETKTEGGNSDIGKKLGDYKGLKHAIGCKDFDNQSGWHGRWEIGRNLSIMLESALADSGRFVIVEREKLGDVLLEQNLAASGRMAKSKVAKTGLIRPARYIGTGAVTEVEDAQSGGGGGISFKGIRLGGGKSEAQVTVIVKLVDTTTSEIVVKERIVGKAGRLNLKIGLDIAGVSTDLGGFKKTPLGQAAQDCINQAAAVIAKKMEEFPFEGAVIKTADGGKVLINRGEEFGVEAGQELIMGSEGATITDPDTGAILGKEEGQTIGKLKVSKVDKKFSYCDVTSGEKRPPAGTVVRSK